MTTAYIASSKQSNYPKPQPRKQISDRDQEAILRRLQRADAIRLSEALEFSMNLFACASELALESGQMGEGVDPTEVLERAVRDLAPDDDEKLLMWATVKTALEVLERFDVVVLTKGS